MPGARKERPLVYSCSGCSSAAQMANHLALALDRRGLAEMSCIAGVGGGVAPLVKLARSGRPVIAIDGCELACVQHCLAQRCVEPVHHILLNREGVRKRMHADFDQAEANGLLARLEEDIARLRLDQARLQTGQLARGD